MLKWLQCMQAHALMHVYIVPLKTMRRLPKADLQEGGGGGATTVEWEVEVEVGTLGGKLK